jgi:hypothetical protein
MLDLRGSEKERGAKKDRGKLCWLKDRVEPDCGISLLVGHSSEAL